MKTEKVKLADLRHPEKNVRIHTEKQIQEMIRSIEMFGQIRPVVIDEKNVILAGNGLVEAMRKMGLAEADALRVTGLTETQKKKLMLADNKIYSLGVDDLDVIYEMLREFEDDFDVPGFDEDLLRDLLADVDHVDEKIQEYGKLAEEEIEEIRLAAERKEERIMRAQAVQEDEPTDDIDEDDDGGNEVPAAGREHVREWDDDDESYEEDEEGGEYIRGSVEMERVQPMRYIVCPHCGEKVYL